MSSVVTHLTDVKTGMEQLCQDLDQIIRGSMPDADKSVACFQLCFCRHRGAIEDLMAAHAAARGNGDADAVEPAPVVEGDEVSRADLLDRLDQSVGSIESSEELVRAANIAQNEFWAYWNGETFSTRQRTDEERHQAIAEQHAGNFVGAAPQ